MKLVSSIIFFLPILAFSKGAEQDTFLIRREAEINILLDSLRKAKDDMSIEMINEDFKNQVKDLIVYPGVMDYPFSKWTTVSTITSPDGAFRIFNWNVEDEQGMHRHYCFVVKPNGNENIVIELQEDKLTIPPRPEHTLTPEHWYGALYYNIIPVKKGSKTLYTIFGYNGNDRSTNRKLLDVFYFKGKSLRMGYPLFQEAPGSSHLLRRVFFEYSEQAIMSLRMNDNLGAIVFDHLVPENPQLEGIYDYYIPDMTYDGYKWENGVWVYKEDIIAYNTDKEIVRNYVPGEDEDFYRETTSNWIDPVDPNAPNGSGTSAIAPIENVNDNSKTKKNKGSKNKNRQFRIRDRQKGPRSAITGERTRNKRK